MFISGYIDPFYNRIPIRLLYAIFSMLFLLYHHYQYGEYHDITKIYSFIFVMFNCLDIVQKKLNIMGFNTRMSCTRMTFIIFTTYYNVVSIVLYFLIDQVHCIMLIYNILFLIDILRTMKYIVEMKNNIEEVHIC